MQTHNEGGISCKKSLHLSAGVLERLEKDPGRKQNAPERKKVKKGAYSERYQAMSTFKIEIGKKGTRGKKKNGQKLNALNRPRRNLYWGEKEKKGSDGRGRHEGKKSWKGQRKEMNRPKLASGEDPENLK